MVDDVNGDGALDFVGTSLTLGQGFIVEQVKPLSSLVVTVSLPDSFVGTISVFMLALVKNFPPTGPPDAVLASVQNDDKDGDGMGDVDAILSPSHDLILSFKDAKVSGDFYIMAAVYVEGGGLFQPLAGMDYVATSPPYTFGEGQVVARLDLELMA